VADSSDLRDEPRDAGSGFADAHSGEVIAADRDEEFANGVRSATESDERDRSDRPRGRSGRRRGRSRGRRSSGEQGEGRASEQRERKPPRSAPRTERVDRTADDDLDDDFDSDDPIGELDAGAEDGDEGEEVVAGAGATGGRSALQRSIPSWDEAIGFIVDTNMESRPQRRPSPRSGGRDGGRGRPRGRRKQ
jgi:hypothetical protein